jgi:hypothetical protein
MDNLLRGSPPSLKLRLSNEDAAFRLGFHDTAALNPLACTDRP